MDIYEEDFDMASGIYFYKKIKEEKKRKQLIENKKNIAKLDYDKRKAFNEMSGIEALSQEAIFNRKINTGTTAKNNFKNRYMGNILTAFSDIDLKEPTRLETRWSKIKEEMIDGDMLILIPDNGLTSECWTNTNKYSIVYTVLDAKLTIGQIVQKDVLNFLMNG